MMLNSKETQFALTADGKILWQEKINNPLPGVEVAVLEKGDHPLRPKIAVMENTATQGVDRDTLRNHLSIWMNGHLSAVLESLMLLGMPSTGGQEDEVSTIAKHVYDGLGIVQRSDIEDVILKLDPEKRTALRAKKIRLGPILVFMPALTKPAAVKLRAVLWSLYNGQTLPAQVPADGIVSTKVDDPEANPDFYRAIGYPLYGGRAIRIDMLDRVINTVYENAKGGKFQARHQMAEWLGSTIEDLYRILEAMGHRKVSEPLEKPADEAKIEAAQTEVADVAVEDGQEPVSAAPPEVKVPELATFLLKKGKAFEAGRKPFKPRNQDVKEATTDGTSDKRKDDKRPPYNKDKKQDKDRKKAHHKKDKDSGPRVISIEARHKDESPFAILQQLKVKSDS